jgi:arylsulfatase A-like enzyme
VAFITKHAQAGGEGKPTPFFVYLPFNAVHGPMEATQKYRDRFPQITDENRRTDAGMLTALDEAVGRVLAAVKESGQEDNPLVFFFSDNGGPTPQTTSSNGPLNGYKTQMLEGGIRVPFLMKWPGGGVPAGNVYELPVMSLDVHATVLAAAGFDLNAPAPPTGREKTDKPQPGMLEGHNLVPFVTATGDRAKVGPHEAIFWRMGNQWAVRKGDWKLVSQARPNARQPGEVRLYNLREDIGETNDLAAKMPEKVAELRAAYDAWNAGNIDPLWRRSEGRGERGGDEADPAPANRPGEGARPAGGGAGAARIREAFDRLDTNKDGSLTAEEYNADAAISARRPFAEIDANKDGKASYEEVAAAFAGGGGGPPRRRPAGGG